MFVPTTRPTTTQSYSNEVKWAVAKNEDKKSWKTTELYPRIITQPPSSSFEFEEDDDSYFDDTFYSSKKTDSNGSKKDEKKGGFFSKSAGFCVISNYVFTSLIALLVALKL